MRPSKIKQISTSLHDNFYNLIKVMYLDKQMSSPEISDTLFKLTNVKISTRSIQKCLKRLGIIRTYSQAFNLAINKGRKDYSHLRRPIKSSALRKGINLKLRYIILKIDHYKCVLCGNTAKDTILVVDHIIPVVKGGKNEPHNLRTLCRECNHGKMILEERN